MNQAKIALLDKLKSQDHKNPTQQMYEEFKRPIESVDKAAVAVYQVTKIF
jgi:hypothetical protein